MRCEGGGGGGEGHVDGFRNMIPGGLMMRADLRRAVTLFERMGNTLSVGSSMLVELKIVKKVSSNDHQCSSRPGKSCCHWQLARFLESVRSCLDLGPADLGERLLMGYISGYTLMRTIMFQRI